MKRALFTAILSLMVVVLVAFSGQAMVLTSPDNVGQGGLQGEVEFGYVPPQNGSSHTFISLGPAVKFGLTDRLDLVGSLSFGRTSHGSIWNDLSVGANLALLKTKYLVSAIQPTVTVDLVVPWGGERDISARVYSQTGLQMGKLLPYFGFGYDRVLTGGGASWFGVDIGSKVGLFGGLSARANLNYFFGYSTGSRNVYTLTGALSYQF